VTVQTTAPASRRPAPRPRRARPPGTDLATILPAAPADVEPWRPPAVGELLPYLPPDPAPPGPGFARGCFVSAGAGATLLAAAAAVWWKLDPTHGTLTATRILFAGVLGAGLAVNGALFGITTLPHREARRGR
jgi:hypothetical protein